MAEPKIKQGNADAHRQKKQSDETDDPTPDDDNEIEVEATTGGDDPDPDDDPKQGFGGRDGGGGSIFSNKKFIGVVIALAIIGLYLAAKNAEGNASGGNPNRKKASSPEEIDDALASTDAPEGRMYDVPRNDTDPLSGDEYVLKNTDIFPSLQESGG